MVREIEELEEILEEIYAKVMEANRRDELDDLLVKWGFDDITTPAPIFESFKGGKIVVLGQSEVKESVLLAIANSLGIEKSRFEFCLDYDLVKKYNFRKLCCAPQYRVVLVGPMPHKTAGTGDSSSAIAEMEANRDYPRVVRLSGSNALKITKNSFRDALQTLIAEEYIQKGETA